MTTTAVMRKQLFINGEWRDATGGKTIEVVNPATEEVIAEVASADKSDVDAAVAAARAALDGPWGKLSARERGKLIWKIGEKLLEKADEIARLETLHNGKPIFESRQIEVPASAECFQYYAGWADKIHGETVPVKGNYLTYTLREPVGVVAAIVPWNFPLLLTSWKVAPALACGNTVIIKPASQTPLTALALAEIAQEIGLPAGVINVVTGPGSKVGQMLVEHPGIDKIAFTGDTSTGKGIMKGSADTLKRITLELGGKSPNIVFPDADLDAAIRGATTGIFYGKGEVCAAGSRLLVDTSIKSEFVDVDEAIARANDSNYGLAAAVWTKDIKKAHYVARKLQAGTVWINTYNIYDTAAPFGGYKQSGFGREMSMHALEHYTQVKSVWVDLNQ